MNPVGTQSVPVTQTAQPANGKVRKQRVHKNYGLSQADFITAVETLGSLAEVSKKTGMSIGGIRSRIKYYRKQGIDVKEFSAGPRKRLDVKAANELVAKLRKNAKK